MYRGIIIEESLRDRGPLALLSVTASKRVEITEPGEGQPPVWTVTDFEIEDAQAGALAESLSASLTPGPWYVDFNDGNRSYVVFAGRVFSYARGDEASLARTKDFALSVGVPVSQIDWAVPE